MPLKIPFHVPFVAGDEHTYVQKVIKSNKIETGGYYSQACQEFLEDFTQTKKALLTSSCTHALEMAAILFNIEAGDEVIMPSYNFVSAANAFVLRGAKIVFVDINPQTMNIDPDCIASAITDKTKAVLIMHYGGVACDMDSIMPIVKRHKLYLVEDAAHCIGSFYKGKHLGTFGHLGTLSFHYTKNIHCGEGGALLINDLKLIDRAEIIREKGTNRKQFFEGKVDKYSWVDIGSSYLMSELSAAFLWGQLQKIETVTTSLRLVWHLYNTKFEQTEILSMPKGGNQNGHTYFIKCKDKLHRSKLIKGLSSLYIKVSFHYIPLHVSKFGKSNTRFDDKDRFTTRESEKILRLPIYNNFKNSEEVFNEIIKLY